MDEWLTEGGTPDYPATWRGLVTLLVDSDCYQVAEDLKHALASVIPPTSPPLVDSKLSPETTPAEQDMPYSQMTLEESAENMHSSRCCCQ